MPTIKVGWDGAGFSSAAFNPARLGTVALGEAFCGRKPLFLKMGAYNFGDDNDASQRVPLHPKRDRQESKKTSSSKIALKKLAH